MAKKMRRQFVAVSMSAFLVVMLLVLLGINLVNYFQSVESQNRVIDGILEYEGMYPSGENQKMQNPPITAMPWAGGGATEFTKRFFVVHCDEKGNVTVFGNDYITSVDKDAAELYTKDVLDSRMESGVYQDYRFKVDYQGEELVIVFLNIADSVNANRTLLVISSLIGLISLMAVFGLVVIFSRYAVQPFEKNNRQQKQFITDAGHELKTPITSIATSADILAMEEENEWVQNIQKQSARLMKLVNDLVMLTRMDEEAPIYERTDFSFSEAVWETAESFDKAAKAKEIRYEKNVEENLSYKGDRMAIQRMVSILLDNAVKYTPALGEIRLWVYRKHEKIQIEVYNTCLLKSTKDLDRLFDRFYRPDESRSSDTGGSGIGLSIAKSVAVAHGGNIKVSSQDGKSILFKVTL